MYLYKRTSTSQALLASQPQTSSYVTLYLGKWYVEYHKRNGGPGTMGRFGGGWEWALGFTVGGSGTVIFNLLVCTLRIARQNDRNNETTARSKPRG